MHWQGREYFKIWKGMHWQGQSPPFHCTLKGKSKSPPKISGNGTKIILTYSIPLPNTFQVLNYAVQFKVSVQNLNTAAKKTCPSTGQLA